MKFLDTEEDGVSDDLESGDDESMENLQNEYDDENEDEDENEDDDEVMTETDEDEITEEEESGADIGSDEDDGSWTLKHRVMAVGNFAILARGIFLYPRIPLSLKLTFSRISKWLLTAQNISFILPFRPKEDK